jgi:hypothetical protein
MPLRNRVTPFGEIVAMPERGTLMGNRGGRIHDEARAIVRPWASRRWIACELVYKDWRRTVMCEGYTELFFLDEVTALAAGHRPCFFCRRAEAKAFARAFAVGQGTVAPRDADAMDLVLHRERLERGRKRLHRVEAASLPDAAMFTAGGSAFAISGQRMLRWTAGGWRDAGPRTDDVVELLTPPSIVASLAAGYRPRWHCSANR